MLSSRQILLTPNIKDEICQNLTFDDAIRFRDALGLPSLKCSIAVIDSQTQKKIILPGVNPVTIDTYELIKKYGLDLALIIAAQKGQDLIVQTLLKAGANVEAVSDNGLTASMWASVNGHNSVVQTLLKAGANVETVDRFGWTALMHASVHGRDSVVQTLLKAGANVGAVDQDGWTALTYASINGRNSVVQTLKAAGAH